MCIERIRPFHTGDGLQLHAAETLKLAALRVHTNCSGLRAAFRLLRANFGLLHATLGLLYAAAAKNSQCSHRTDFCSCSQNLGCTAGISAS